MAVWIIIAETKVHDDVTSRIIGCTRIARLPFEGVVTGTAVEDIIPLTTDDKVIPTTAKDKVIPGAAVEDIIPLITKDKVIPTTTKEKVIPGAAVNSVIRTVGISFNIEQLMIFSNIIIELLGCNGRRVATFSKEKP